jgi:hypothetical protein
MRLGAGVPHDAAPGLFIPELQRLRALRPQAGGPLDHDLLHIVQTGPQQREATAPKSLLNQPAGPDPGLPRPPAPKEQPRSPGGRRQLLGLVGMTAPVREEGVQFGLRNCRPRLLGLQPDQRVDRGISGAPHTCVRRSRGRRVGHPCRPHPDPAARRERPPGPAACGSTGRCGRSRHAAAPGVPGRCRCRVGAGRRGTRPLQATPRPAARPVPRAARPRHLVFLSCPKDTGPPGAVGQTPRETCKRLKTRQSVGDTPREMTPSPRISLNPPHPVGRGTTRSVVEGSRRPPHP